MPAPGSIEPITLRLRVYRLVAQLFVNAAFLVFNFQKNMNLSTQEITV